MPFHPLGEEVDLSLEPQNPNTLGEHVEFEAKYRIEGHLLTEFKKLLEALPDNKSFIYVEGPDYYYVREDLDEGSFARYRRPSYGLDNGRCEVTFKIKPKGAKNNIRREEYNWRVDGTPEDTIRQALVAINFKFNFSIFKSCHIYKLGDATLVFYTVYDITEGKPSKHDNFIEIEVDEKLTSQLTEEQAYDIIRKYEALLAPLGINSSKRLKRSLFEMYRR